jgi:uncharacterized membrane protein SpoIIM required for sporulation
MNAEQFYQSRRADWEQLAALLEKGQRGVRQLSPMEIKLLGNLYRSATSDLALAQRDLPRHQVTRYLNGLVGRSHALLYHSEPVAAHALWRYVAETFPERVQQSWPFLAAALAIFLLPALVVGLLLYRQPALATWLLPGGVQHLIPVLEERTLWIDIPVAERPYASSFVMTNNIQVSFLAFAGGITGGLLTVYVLFNNGLMLGGLTGLAAHYGVGFDLWTFVIGHGVLELSTIWIAGASGLMLGWAILHPGLLRRRDALVLAARQALHLILGCVPLLIIAGIIEGFVSPNEAVPWPVKWAVGLISGVIFYGYLFWAGRRFRDPAMNGRAMERRPVNRA